MLEKYFFKKYQNMAGIILVYNFFGFQNQETEEISLFANKLGIQYEGF